MQRPLSVALFFALLTGCNGSTTVTPPPPPTGPGPTDSQFFTSGRYIELRDVQQGVSGARVAPDAVKFFVKGMVYSPTPIGKGVADLPSGDNPLGEKNTAVWSRDLPLMRAMGVNAIHVYNVKPPDFDQQTGPIYNFLNAAWNGGNKPVYVLMSIHFPGDALLNSGAVAALAKQYRELDKKYAGYPAVMGVAISNEIVAENFRNNKTWWDNFNIVARAAKQGFVDGGDREKLVTTSEADGNIGSVEFGEKYNAAVDAWGVNIYRGRTLTNLFAQIRRFTKKPVMLTEYGATAAYHVDWKNTYSWTPGLNGLGQCTPSTRNGPENRDVKELPASGNPNMAGLVDYVTNNAKLLHVGYNDGAVVSGGFYFEWTDEWWKADNGANPKYRSQHVGSVTFNGAYPGCGEDAAWYGLNAISKGLAGVDKLNPRPTLAALQQTWALQ
jgi:hypothetical protein